MNFHQVATEIMLHVEDEKWYETRDRISVALQHACAYGQETERVWLSGLSRQEIPGLYWRDQPDGVR